MKIIIFAVILTLSLLVESRGTPKLSPLWSVKITEVTADSPPPLQSRGDVTSAINKTCKSNQDFTVMVSSVNQSSIGLPGCFECEREYTVEATFKSGKDFSSCSLSVTVNNAENNLQNTGDQPMTVQMNAGQTYNMSLTYTPRYNGFDKDYIGNNNVMVYLYCTNDDGNEPQEIVVCGSAQANLQPPGGCSAPKLANLLRSNLIN